MPKVDITNNKERIDELRQQKEKDNTLVALGQSLAQEKIKNIQKTNLINSIGQELAKVKLPATSYNLQALLVKPQTYMNRSGESIKKLITNYELPITNIVIAHDDLDIELGKFKIQQGVGPKKHNGLSSIEQHLHTNNFLRIRIGIDGRQGDRTLPGEEYVLQNFSQNEENILENLFTKLTISLSKFRLFYQ